MISVTSFFFFEVDKEIRAWVEMEPWYFESWEMIPAALLVDKLSE